MKYNPKLARDSVQFILWNGFYDRELGNLLDEMLPLLESLTAMFIAKGIARGEVRA